MISRKYKCIFLEVPKTGSSSIRGIIGRPYRPHLDLMEVKEKVISSFPFEGSKQYRYINKIYSLVTPDAIKEKIGAKVFDTYYKFGFVRNPWSRTVSLYNRKEGVQMKDKMSFEEFVDWINYSSDTCIYPSQKRNQLDWFKDSHGNVSVDFIGKFENLAQHWGHIASELGIDQELSHLNSNKFSSRKHYTEYYNEKTKEIIRKKFAVDIEYFEYEFEK